ncbi:hypothetical protein QQZ08_000730 [Neonectria magnoliae]|uniref:Uncharacterized protein n=1 Tax=Neonectria magnoliae TaxID=2732573 RepID=A0ABR1IGU5_9HYPO
MANFARSLKSPYLSPRLRPSMPGRSVSSSSDLSLPSNSNSPLSEDFGPDVVSGRNTPTPLSSRRAAPARDGFFWDAEDVGGFLNAPIRGNAGFVLGQIPPRDMIRFSKSPMSGAHCTYHHHQPTRPVATHQIDGRPSSAKLEAASAHLASMATRASPSSPSKPVAGQWDVQALSWRMAHGADGTLRSLLLLLFLLPSVSSSSLSVFNIQAGPYGH